MIVWQGRNGDRWGTPVVRWGDRIWAGGLGRELTIRSEVVLFGRHLPGARTSDSVLPGSPESWVVKFVKLILLIVSRVGISADHVDDPPANCVESVANSGDHGGHDDEGDIPIPQHGGECAVHTDCSAIC